MEKQKLSDEALEQVTGGTMRNNDVCTCNCQETYIENGQIRCSACNGIKMGSSADAQPQVETLTPNQAGKITGIF